MKSDCEDKFGLRPLWDELLLIYEVFARICAKHGLRHYGFAGTALGAVRHKGFIPWDDDLDVIMPRPDYEKFIAIAGEELPSHLKFVYWRNTPELNLLAGKIQDIRKDKILALEKQLGFILSNGLFIDVYPIDGYPSGLQYWRAKMEVFVLDSIWRYAFESCEGRTLAGKAKWFFGKILSSVNSRWRKKSWLMEHYESILLRSPFMTSDYVGDIGYSKTIFLHPPLRKEVWGEPSYSEFEGLKIPLPANVDAHLQNNYGKDFMALPPEEKRKPTHGFILHFPWWLGPTHEAKSYSRGN